MTTTPEHSAETTSFHTEDGTHLRSPPRGPYTGASMAGAPNPRLQGRIELMIRVVAPVLDLGQGLSRLVHRGASEPLATPGLGDREATR